MSKEKNIQQADPVTKKERTSVLEKIRRRTGLLVGIVGLALVIFILESLLGSGASIFGGDEQTTVGSINGKKIDRNEFVTRVENQLNNYRQRNQKNDVDEGVRGSVIDNVWQQYVVDLAIKPQFEKAGITVGEDELYDRVVANPVQFIIQQLSDQQTGKLNEQFARPDGSMDLVKWKQAVQNLPADQEVALLSMEENVKSTRFFEKYRMLINKGLYVTTAEAKEIVKLQTTNFNIAYTIKRFDSVSDSSMKYTDSDLQKFYKENSYQFMNQETSRRIEYVVFNVMASESDIAAIEKDAQRAAEEFKGKTASEDSSFIAQESENGNITIQDFTKKTMIIRDSTVFTASPGTVYGPYNEGAYFKIYKLEGINSIADSAEVRHILVGLNDPQTQQPKRSKVQAKKEADSLLVLIKANKVSFDSLVRNFSDDMGSKTNGGNYGWFDENEGFVAPFKNAGLMGTKGNISVVETNFGYHIIEVLNVSKAHHNSYTVAQIFKLIAPSDETNQAIFAKASQFAGENNNAELFDKAIETQKLTKRIGDNIKEGERQISGLEGAKELVKWVYSAEIGEVNLFTLADKHVVAKLTGIRNKGVLPFEEVKDLVTQKVIQEKKAEQFKGEFEKALASSKSIEDLAGKLNINVMRQEALNGEAHNIEGLGHDDILAGTALGLKPQVMSKVITAENGVGVLVVNSIQNLPPTQDSKAIQQQTEQTISSRTDYEVFNAIKELSDVEDHKSRID